MWELQIGKELLDKELAARYHAFDSGKPVKGCRGARDMHIRLMGLRLSNLRDELAGVRTGSLDAVCSTLSPILACADSSGGSSGP
jgi:hypothetical protein